MTSELERALNALPTVVWNDDQRAYVALDDVRAALASLSGPVDASGEPVSYVAEMEAEYQRGPIRGKSLLEWPVFLAMRQAILAAAVPSSPAQEKKMTTQDYWTLDRIEQTLTTMDHITVDDARWMLELILRLAAQEKQ